MKPIVLSQSHDIEDKEGFVQYLAALATGEKYVLARYLGEGKPRYVSIDKLTARRYQGFLPGGWATKFDPYPSNWLGFILYEKPFNPMDGCLSMAQ